MKALIIFNGIRFPHHVVDKAFAWAKENSGSVHVLFLAGRETEEQYPFPSDLDEAQDATDKSDAEQDDLRVLESHIQLLENMAANDKLSCTTEIMVEPSIEAALAKAKEADIIFVEADYEDVGLMSVNNFKFQDLIDQLPPNVEKVENDDRR